MHYKKSIKWISFLLCKNKGSTKLCTKEVQELDFIYANSNVMMYTWFYFLRNGGKFPMVLDMLKKENVQIVQRVEDWKEAVRISIQPLVDGGYVESRYIDGVIENTIEYGPYYVLVENVALIHGRPEQGVKEKQLAVTVLKEPVQFSETSFPARLLVTLAATDGESHIDVMRALAGIFMDTDKINEILEANSAEEVYQLFLEADTEDAE